MSPPRNAREPGASKEAIVDAAERLFGRHGLDGVSLRQIAAESGSLNNFAVQYHFGGKAGLVRAIFETRLPQLELRRAAMLSRAKRDGRLQDVQSLVEIIFRPIAETRDEAGRMSYAAFLLSLFHAHDSLRSWIEVIDLAPITEHVIGLLATALPHLPREVFGARTNALTALFLVSLLKRDPGSGLQDELAIEDMLAVAAAGLAAPVPAAVAAAFPVDI
jgi:AcrR family transcriptional regulator